MIVQDKKALGWKKFLAHGFLLSFLALVLFPFLVVLSISFREGNYAIGSLWPDNPTLEHWALAFGLPYERMDGTVVQPQFPVLRWLWNSVKIGVLASAGVLLLSTTAAYAFSRLRFRGRDFILDSLLVIQMFPPALAAVAIYAIFDSLGEVTPVLGIDSHWSLVLVYMSGITLYIWTIKGYFDSIDPALDEAAIMDGATPWQAFRYVFLPLSVPILAVVFVLSFIFMVAEYPIASILLRKIDHMTLAVGARQFLYEHNYMWGDFAAAAILSGLPITILFLFAQRYLVAGLSEGGVKG